MRSPHALSVLLHIAGTGSAHVDDKMRKAASTGTSAFSLPNGLILARLSPVIVGPIDLEANPVHRGLTCRTSGTMWGSRPFPPLQRLRTPMRSLRSDGLPYGAMGASSHHHRHPGSSSYPMVPYDIVTCVLYEGVHRRAGPRKPSSSPTVCTESRAARAGHCQHAGGRSDLCDFRRVR